MCEGQGFGVVVLAFFHAREAMKRSCIIAAGLCIVIGAGWAAFGALTAVQEQAAQALIKDFGAKEFAARQAAVEKLIAFGPDVLPLVRKELGETADAEVKLRCQMTLKGITDKYGTGDAGHKPDAKAAANFGASKITLEAKEQSLGEVMEKFADLSGNQAVDVPDDLRDKAVTASIKDLGYWQALDKVCSAAGLMYSPDYNTGKLRIQEAEKADNLSGYSEAVVVKMDQGTESRSFRLAKPPKNAAVAAAPRGGTTIFYQMSYFWEDRLAPITTEVELTKAQTPDGKNLMPDDQFTVVRALGGGRQGGLRQRTMGAGTTQVNIPEVPDGLKQLTEISGIVRLEFGDGQKEVSINDVLAAADKTVQIGEWTLTVKGTEKTANAVTVRVELRRGDKLAWIPAAWQTGEYGFYLVGEDGARHRSNGGGGGGGFRGGRGGAGRRNGPGGGGPANLVPMAGPNAQGANAPGVPDELGKYGIRFMRLGDIQGTWSLVLVLPDHYEMHEYPFTIKDVPRP
jgi:hypothetical protein